MRRIAVLCFLFIMLFYYLGGVMVVSACGYSRFDTEVIPTADRVEFLEDIQFVQSFDSNPINQPISYFAISQQGQIALGFNDSDYASVYVYDVAGNFLYGYRFENHLCSFAVLFEGEKLTIIWDRSDYIGSFDPMGNCIQLCKFSDTKNNADEEYKEQWRSAKGTIGELSYHAKRSGILPKYTVFTVTDAEGNETVIYDAQKEVLTRNLLLGAGIACFISFVVYGIYYQEKQKNNDMLQ